MKSFSTVYNKSKRQVIDARNQLYESQKDSLIKVLKETYMITGNMSSLPIDKQKSLMIKLAKITSQTED